LHENKYLSHACLEGPEDGVYYRGEGKIENKSVEISLPDYVDALAHNFTVQLTQSHNIGDSNTSPFVLSNVTVPAASVPIPVLPTQIVLPIGDPLLLGCVVQYIGGTGNFTYTCNSY